MYQSKPILILAVTLCISTMAMRAPQTAFHLEIEQSPNCANGKVWDAQEQICVCPIDRPYISRIGNCVACLSPQFWVSKLQICMICPQGFEANKEEGRCHCPIDKPYINSQRTCQACHTVWDQNTKTCLTCPKGQIFNASSQKCQCPRQYQVDATGSCVSCPSPAVWDLKNKKCVRCPEGLTFNHQISQCVCPKERPYLNHNKTCQTCNGTWDKSKLICIECDVNQTWNASSKQCQCQPFNFKNIAGKCVPCPHPAIWDIKNKKCVRCPVGFVYDQNASQCACPTDKPYLDQNNSCRSCNTKWDVDALKCQICISGTVWNNSTQKCEKKCPYQIVAGKCKCPLDKPVFDQASQSCLPCKAQTPVWNGKECKACPNFSNYLPSMKSCHFCIQGMNFNKSVNQCQFSS